MNSEYEYYGRAASLIHITLDGSGDVKLPRHARASICSAAASMGLRAVSRRRAAARRTSPNPNPYTWTFRALLADYGRLGQKDGEEPPPSKYPRVAAHELVPLAGVQFPKIPGVAFPTIMHLAYPSNYGPDFRTKGIATQEPPEIGQPYPLMVPQVDRDGLDIAGIRMPETRGSTRHLYRLEPARP